MRDLLPDELGEVNVGDIIIGNIFTDKLVVERKEKIDGYFIYYCRYIEGLNNGQLEIIRSYYNYQRI